MTEQPEDYTSYRPDDWKDEDWQCPICGAVNSCFDSYCGAGNDSYCGAGIYDDNWCGYHPTPEEKEQLQKEE